MSRRREYFRLNVRKGDKFLLFAILSFSHTLFCNFGLVFERLFGTFVQLIFTWAFYPSLLITNSCYYLLARLTRHIMNTSKKKVYLESSKVSAHFKASVLLVLTSC